MREAKTMIERAVRDLYDSYVDACAMCTTLECNDCMVQNFIHELEETGICEIVSSTY